MYLSIENYLSRTGGIKTIEKYYNQPREIIHQHSKLIFNAIIEGKLQVLQGILGEAPGLGLGQGMSALCLHLAAERGHAEIIHYLVEELYIDVDISNIQGMTALHYAVRANKIGSVRELLRLGATPSLQNDQGKTPLKLCRDRFMQRILLPKSSLLLDSTSSSPLRLIDYLGYAWLSPKQGQAVGSLMQQYTLKSSFRYPEQDHDGTKFPELSECIDFLFPFLGPQTKVQIDKECTQKICSVFTSETRMYTCCHCIYQDQDEVVLVVLFSQMPTFEFFHSALRQVKSAWGVTNEISLRQALIQASHQVADKASQQGVETVPSSSDEIYHPTFSISVPEKPISISFPIPSPLPT